MKTVPLFHFPNLMLWEEQLSWDLAGELAGSGQTSVTGPVARLDGGGGWKATFGQIEVFLTAERLTWHALTAICDGGARPIVMPFRASPEDIPFPSPGGIRLTGHPPVLHAGGAPFSSGVGYHAGVIDATLGSNARLGATRLQLGITYGADLQGGHFSINHPGLRWRLYRIGTVKKTGTGTFSVTVMPPLRADTTAGTKLEFDRPKCVMRLATGAAMDAVFQKNFISQPSPSFVEAFPPFPVPE